MFRGGKVIDSRGTGITSGLMDGGRVGYYRGGGPTFNPFAASQIAPGELGGQISRAAAPARCKARRPIAVDTARDSMVEGCRSGRMHGRIRMTDGGRGARRTDGRVEDKAIFEYRYDTICNTCTLESSRRHRRDRIQLQSCN